jgi:sugar lactone lactonase YvrE
LLLINYITGANKDGFVTFAGFSNKLQAITVLKNASVLFISDYASGRIRRIDLANEAYVSTVASIVTPNGIAIDTNETFMYVVSTTSCVVYRLSLIAAFPINVTDSMIFAGIKNSNILILFIVLVQFISHFRRIWFL